jgi:hypothetical protein
MITPDWFVIEEMKMTDRENGGSLQFQMIIEKILYTTSDPQRTAKSININQNNQNNQKIYIKYCFFRFFSNKLQPRPLVKVVESPTLNYCEVNLKSLERREMVSTHMHRKNIIRYNCYLFFLDEDGWEREKSYKRF